MLDKSYIEKKKQLRAQIKQISLNEWALDVEFMDKIIEPKKWLDSIYLN